MIADSYHAQHASIAALRRRYPFLGSSNGLRAGGIAESSTRATQQEVFTSGARAGNYLPSWVSTMARPAGSLFVLFISLLLYYGSFATPCPETWETYPRSLGSKKTSTTHKQDHMLCLYPLGMSKRIGRPLRRCVFIRSTLARMRAWVDEGSVASRASAKLRSQMSAPTSMRCP